MICLKGICWIYDATKGGIFDEPTIFPTAHGLKGVGEAGPEASRTNFNTHGLCKISCERRK